MIRRPGRVDAFDRVLLLAQQSSDTKGTAFSALLRPTLLKREGLTQTPVNGR